MAMLLIGVTVGVVLWIWRFLIRRRARDVDAPDGASILGDNRPPRPLAPLTGSFKSFIWLSVRRIALPIVLLFIVFLGLGYFGKPPSDQLIHPYSDLRVRLLIDRLADRELLMGLAYFVIMLAGMAAEYMFGLKDFKKFTLSEFIRPFWVALIVFSVPWSLVDKSTLTFGSVLACYQNGFFWKKVLERRRGR
jgi:hypothetical protein